MGSSGWKQLVEGAPWFRGAGSYPIAAYSEFMPPPRLVRKPCGGCDPLLFAEDDPWGWHVSEYEEAFELRPGLEHVARQIVGVLEHLCCGRPAHGISKNKLAGNPCWPPELAERADGLGHERHVVFLPLALSRTQDDKGRIRWTLFGGSDQGPSQAFWKSFYSGPREELPEALALDFFVRLLRQAFDEPLRCSHDLFKSGFRILRADAGERRARTVPAWDEGPLPGWTAAFRWRPEQSLRAVKYLLTFRPFAELPPAVRRAYREGRLHLLPSPSSLVFWGCPPYFELERQLPFALQIPLLHSVARHEGPFCIRVPQSGWLHEPRAGNGGEPRFPLRNTYKRTHRWARVYRDEDELAQVSHEEKLARVLFSTRPEDVRLYDKPMARNVQIWDADYHVVLNGPAADRDAIREARDRVLKGGAFGYRFLYPAMRVGCHEVYWHRPLVAYLSAQTGQPTVLPGAPLGYLTAWPIGRGGHRREPAAELWPRLLAREHHVAGLHLFEHTHDHRPRQTTINVRKLLDARPFFGRQPLPRSLARQMLSLHHNYPLESWLSSLPERASDPERARWLVAELEQLLSPAQEKVRFPEPLTYRRTARRAFELAYWKTISFLAVGKYVNKDNADCVRDKATQARLRHHHRDLDALGDFLLGYYERKVRAARLGGKALVGEMRFPWRTDFDFSWWGGWLKNQEEGASERNLVVVIPGRDRSRAVIMADHYDTAYMEDVYGAQHQENGPRLSAAGADDNHSATAALMLGAPIFMALSRAGKLACDIWLVHLTGEEFPADCLGARNLCQRLVERDLKLKLTTGEERDLSGIEIQGAYVLDMVAHNNDRQRDVFQISPGTRGESFWLAYQAHLANEIWNERAPTWNRRPGRRGAGPGRRSPNGRRVPATALHPQLSGEVRLPYDPRSSVYNTDVQIFSDAGVPVVLFMENYDINRSGYHDSHDNMTNIDLDYGSAVAAIAIESVARAASSRPSAEWRSACLGVGR